MNDNKNERRKKPRKVKAKRERNMVIMSDGIFC